MKLVVNFERDYLKITFFYLSQLMFRSFNNIVNRLNNALLNLRVRRLIIQMLENMVNT